VHLGSRIQRIDATTVMLDDGSTLPADLVIMAIGVRPDSRLAAAAGLATSPGGGVDASLRSSDSRIHVVLSSVGANCRSGSQRIAHILHGS
jgi:NAD(P)H-nitrite reductase large subunit